MENWHLTLNRSSLEWAVFISISFFFLQNTSYRKSVLFFPKTHLHISFYVLLYIWTIEILLLFLMWTLLFFFLITFSNSLLSDYIKVFPPWHNLTFWARRFVVAWGCVMYDRTFSSILGLYAIDANSIPAVCGDWKMPPDIAKCLVRHKIAPGWETLIFIEVRIDF